MNWYKKAAKEKPFWPKPTMSDEEYDRWNSASEKKWTSVDSSFIAGVTYDEDRDELGVKMNGEREYFFEGVPKDVFDDFMASGSKGQFFNNVIRKKYRRKKI